MISHLATGSFDNDCMHITAVLPIPVNPQEDVHLDCSDITVNGKVSYA